GPNSLPSNRRVETDSWPWAWVIRSMADLSSGIRPTPKASGVPQPDIARGSCVSHILIGSCDGWVWAGLWDGSCPDRRRLRKVVGGAADAELLHPAAERVRVQPEDLRRPARPLHDPVGLAQDGEDVFPLGGFERGGLCRSLILASRRFDDRRQYVRPDGQR